MAKGYVKIGRTTEGKYFAQVQTVNHLAHVTTHYETPEYITQEMAQADAECWREFHMVETPETPAREFSIYEDDKVYEFGALLNTTKVLDFIGKTLNEKPDTVIRYGELTGLFTGYEGFVLHICIGNPESRMAGNWRRFTVISSDQKSKPQGRTQWEINETSQPG